MDERTITRPVAGAVACLLCTSLATCGDSPVSDEEPLPGGLAVVSAPITADTVDAQPMDAFVLSVRHEDGTPMVGTTVTFEAKNAQVSAVGPFSQSASVTTDSRGEVAILVRLGTEAGPALVQVEVPAAGLSHTLEFQVLPGAFVEPVITPAEVVKVVGATFQVSASAVDRHGNVIGDPLPITIESGPVEQTGSEFTGLSIGEATLSATVDETTVSATVRVVPDGEIVITGNTVAVLGRFDSDNPTVIFSGVPGAREPSVSWDPSGNRIVMGARTSGFLVYDLVNDVASPSTWPGGEAGSNVLWPRFGPGGRIYYSASDGGEVWDLRSANPDGSNPEILIPAERFEGNDFFPDWAPDGSAFAFIANWEDPSRFLLRISDPDAVDITTIDVVANTPVWSPDGTLIAYQELDVVGVVSPDGSVDMSWEPGWKKGITWSPDGDMLVGIQDEDAVIAVLDIATGATVTLPHFGNNIRAVAWRPEGD